MCTADGFAYILTDKFDHLIGIAYIGEKIEREFEVEVAVKVKVMAKTLEDAKQMAETMEFVKKG